MELIKITEKNYSDPSIVEPVEGGVTRYYKITAVNAGQLNMLEKIFAYMESLGAVGASRQLTIFCDGDGAVRLKFASHGEDEFVFQSLDYDKAMGKDSGYGAYQINDSDGTGKETYFDLG